LLLNSLIHLYSKTVATKKYAQEIHKYLRQDKITLYRW